jgi:type I restriction enzyme S subunit
MKKYEKYKDSGIEWIGEIPEHWKSIPMRFLLRQKITDGPHETPKFITEGVPFLSVDGIKNGELVFEGCRKISEDDHARYKEKCIVEKYDILMGKAASVGKVAQVKVDFEFSIWSPLALLKPNHEKIISSYFEYFLKSKYAKDNANILSTFNTQQNISMADIPRIYYVIPPTLKEQTAIADYLDRKTALIDELIAGKKRLLELYEEEKTAIINQAVTKGINPGVKMKDSGIEWLGEIPEHWEVKKLKYCFNLIGSGTTPKSDELDYYNGDINWLQTGDLNDGHINSTSKKITQKALEEYSTLKIYPPKSIIIAMYGATIGKVGILNIETTTNQACCVLSKPKNVISEYVFYWFLSIRQEVISLSYGGGQPNINQEQIRNLNIQVPSLEEQSAIVNYIEKEVNRINAKAEKTKKLIELLEEYKQALISEVVTGKVKVI